MEFVRFLEAGDYSSNHSSCFIGYVWQSKIAPLEEAFVSTASKFEIPS